MPEFLRFSSQILPEFCSECSPKFLRSFRASFRGKRRPEKNHQKFPSIFQCKISRANSKKTTRAFWRADKVTKSLEKVSFWRGFRPFRDFFEISGGMEEFFRRFLKFFSDCESVRPVQGSKTPKSGKRVSESRNPHFPPPQKRVVSSQKIPIFHVVPCREMGMFFSRNALFCGGGNWVFGLRNPLFQILGFLPLTPVQGGRFRNFLRFSGFFGAPRDSCKCQARSQF